MIEVFVERGQQLGESRKLMKGSSDYAAALALVSIHCAIALNDALLYKLTGQHRPNLDHMEAVRRSKRQCTSKKIPQDGLRHLEVLLKAKTRVSYGNEKATIVAADKLAVASERFETWVLPLIQ